MKRVVLFVTMMITANVFAVGKQEIIPLIKEASAKRESAYVEIRNRITALGANALPLLAEFAVDEALPWQQRLIARICYERIERMKDIKNLIETDWYAHPKFDEAWNRRLTGPEWDMRDMIVADLKEIGLWYYYLEQEWKVTGESAKIQREDRNPFLWRSCCTFAVMESPEERIWFLRICSDILTNPNVYHPRTEHLSDFLRREEKTDAIYVLEHRMPPSISEEPPFRLGTEIIKPAKQE